MPQGALHLLAAVAGEGAQHDVARGVGEHAAVGHGRHLDGGPAELERHFAHPGTVHDEHNLGIGVAAQGIGDGGRVFVRRGVALFVYGLAVDAENDVALAHAGIGRRLVFIGLFHHAAVVLLVVTDNGPDTGILARGHCLQLTGVLLVVVFSIGVEPLEHVVDGIAHTLLGIERIDIIEVKRLVDFIENVELLRHFEIVILLRRKRQGQQQAQC